MRFYEYRGFRPLWIGDEGPLPQAEALLQVIRQAEREGIKPTVYHLSSIEQLMAELGRRDSHDQSQSLRSWVDLELLLTDAFFMYGSHVLTGQINPRDLKEVWFGERSQGDLGAILQQASETDRVAEFLSNIATYACRLCCIAKNLGLRIETSPHEAAGQSSRMGRSCREGIAVHVWRR